MAKKSKKGGTLLGGLVALGLLGSVMGGGGDESTPASSTPQNYDQASVSVSIPAEDVSQELPENTEIPDANIPVEPTVPQIEAEQNQIQESTVEPDLKQDAIQELIQTPSTESNHDTVEDSASKAPPETEQTTIVVPTVTAPAAPDPEPSPETAVEPIGTDYVLNKNTKKFHYPSCSSVKKMKDKNKGYYTGTRDEVISMGYDSCGNCHP